MRDAVVMARSLALWRDPANGSLASDDLYIACRSQSNQKLSSLATKISPKYSWSDIVLPQEQMAQIRELLNYVKYRDVVYGVWGFAQKLSLGKGLNVLFSGLSGTGKTMAAEIIARELGLDLYKIDLSLVVSKYIGETEKNLSAIFREGKDSNAILFFDEADALFGKRSEVKDAHDRYANIETAYLLQKMDEYEGIVILATNLRNNMDEAFTRRMHATVDFPFPEEEYRRRIFEGIFPKQAPLSSDVDFAFLARQFKLTGGNIKNIALYAAFLAAEDNKHIGMAQIIRGTKRELDKIGRLCSKADFGPYYDLMKEADV
jgi:SpoVK/Ycf46/Vps4 family AAA+-type ATPase